MMHHVRKRFFLAGLCLPFLLAAQIQVSPTPCVELQNGRVTLRPTQEETEESTAWDLLLRYPGLTIEGFNQVFTRYQLRIDGIPIIYDARTLLTHIPTAQIRAIQVFENPGVAKGITGTNGVIDIRLKRVTQGTTGLAELQGGTDGYLAPTAQLRYGDKRHDLFALASHVSSEDPIASLQAHRNLLHLQWVNHFSPKDQLYVIYSHQVRQEELPTSESDMKRQLLQCSYTHSFGERGGSFYAMAKYQWSKSPEEESWTNEEVMANELPSAPIVHNEQMTARISMPVGVATLTLPLPAKGSSLVVGWKGRFALNSYARSQQTAQQAIDWQSDYQLYTNEFQGILQYPLGNLLLGLGDRVICFHQHKRSNEQSWVRNQTRNMFQATLTWTPQSAHQLQGGYYRKFALPNDLRIIQPVWPDLTGSPLRVGNAALDATQVELTQLLYVFTAPRLTATVGLNYIHTTDLVKSYQLADGLQSWMNGDKEDTWKLESAASYQGRRLSLTASANLYTTNHTSDETGQATRTNYATFRLTPVLTLPHQFRAEGQFVLFTSKTPWRITNENVCAYGAIRITKDFGQHLRFAAEWHDMFQSSRSAALGSVSYQF